MPVKARVPRGKYRLYSKAQGFYRSPTPGNYAAIVTEKIAGRLDCPSGKRALKKNRIFVEFLSDRPRGFALCRVCKPNRIRIGDAIDCLEPRYRRLTGKPHISLWETGGMVVRERFYVAMHWEDELAQKNFSPHLRYPQALSKAIAKGRQLNLPVIRHDGAGIGITILWLPQRRSTSQERQLIAKLKNSWGVLRLSPNYSAVEFDDSAV